MIIEKCKICEEPYFPFPYSKEDKTENGACGNCNAKAWKNSHENIVKSFERNDKIENGEYRGNCKK